MIQFLPDERLITARKRIFEKVVHYSAPEEELFMTAMDGNWLYLFHLILYLRILFLLNIQERFSRRLGRLLKIPQRKILKKNKK